MNALRLTAAALLVVCLLGLAAGLDCGGPGCPDGTNYVWTCTLSDGGSPFPYLMCDPSAPPIGPYTCPCLTEAPAGLPVLAPRNLPAGDCTWLDGGGTEDGGTEDGGTDGGP